MIESVDPESSWFARLIIAEQTNCADLSLMNLIFCSTEKETMSDDSAEIEIIEEPIQQNGFAAHVKVSQPTTVDTIVSALVQFLNIL